MISRRYRRLTTLTGLSMSALDSPTDRVTAHAPPDRGRPWQPNLADGAHRPLPGVTSPTRDTTGKTIRDNAWRLHRRRRAPIEHIIARLKDWQILRQCRIPGPGIDSAARAVATRYNHRLDQLRLNS